MKNKISFCVRDFPDIDHGRSKEGVKGSKKLYFNGSQVKTKL